MHRMITMHARHRQTDEHHGNSATIHSTKSIAPYINYKGGNYSDVLPLKAADAMAFPI